jgi:alpha-glucosidase
MIRLETLSDKSFKLFFNNYLFIDHNIKNPCFKLGLGTARYKMSHGHFKIKERLKDTINLTDYEIISQSENELKIDFNFPGGTLNVIFLVVDSHLEIKPECTNSDINRFWISIVANEKEAIYGCGAQFSELNLRGKCVPLWVEEQGIGRGDPPITGDWYTTYYPQPTFISSENYYCHIDTSFYSEFNFTQKNSHELYIWEIPKRILLGKYGTALKVVENLSTFLGRQPRLPDWVYDGVILGIQGGIDVVNEKIENSSKHNIKISAVWCQDWQGIRMTSFGKQLFWDWKFDENLYPDLSNFIEILNKNGIKFLGYINPFLAIEGELYKEASKQGYCIKNKDGNDYHLITTDFPTALLDLTNPKAIEWIKSIIKKNMIELGLNGWMVDYGEYLPTDAVLHSGISAEEFHNQYPVIWAKVIYDVLNETDNLKNLLYFTRSGYTHASKYTMLYWPGDQLVNWSLNDGIASVIPGGISLGICGIGYYHYDIGGYTTLTPFKRSKEVFLRWAELATFSMLMRTHEGNRPSENWQFDSDAETLEHLSRLIDIHVNLKPYLIHLSKEYQERGIPPMRGCFLHYEKDKKLHKIKYQFLLGRDLLIAPVIAPNVLKWKVYFPDDVWIHIWSGKEYRQGWNEIDAPLGNPPVFYRKVSKFSNIFENIKKKHFQ